MAMNMINIVTAEPIADDLRQKFVMRRQLSTYYSLASMAAAGNIFNALVICAFFYGQVPAPALAGWFVVVAAVGLMRLRAADVYARCEGSAPAARSFQRIILLSAAMGVTWGAMIASMLSLPSQSQLIPAMIGAGMMSAAASTLNVIPMAALSFIAPIALGGFYGFSRLGTIDGYAACALLVSYCFILSRAVDSSYSNVIASTLNEYELSNQRALLKEQEARSRKLALVAAKTDNAVIVTDADGRIEWVNEGFTRLSGWDISEVLGKRPGAFLQGPQTDPETVRHMSDNLRAGRGFTAELRNYHRCGKPYWVAIEVQPLLDEAGKVMNFMAIERDITERRTSQEALAQYQLHLEDLVETRTEELIRNKLLLEAIVKSAPNGLLLLDERGSISMTNVALEKMFGYGADELVGRLLELLVPGWSAGMVAPCSVEALPMGKLMAFEGRRKDGSIFPVEVVFESFSANERRFVQATITDITQRKQAEDALLDLNANLERKVEQRTMELAAASAAKSEFLANMSHEIRTPMNGILGLAQLLERETLGEEQRNMVERIRQAGQSLLAIINDILDFSKIEAGQLRLEKRAFELRPVLNQVGTLLSGSAQGKGLALHIEAGSNVAGALIGDPLRLEQVLVNLIGNAIKFTEQGEVVIAAEVVAHSASSKRIRFEIRDTGIGISAEQIAKLFSPFTQADATITRRYGGTGLGLSITRRLVGLMGGEIGVDSTPGVGSVFWFEIPFDYAQESIVLPQARRKRATNGGPRLVGVNCLVVDDSNLNRDVIDKLLQKEGARATLAVNGREAVKCLREASDFFDAVLMDIQMPVMDGLDATRAIRHELGLKDLPIVALTAGVLAEQRRLAEEAGCDDFVAKPVDLEELTTVLMRWTARRAPSTAPVTLWREPEENAGVVIPGLNAEHAIAGLGGDRDLYFRLIANFAEEFGHAERAVHERLEGGERDAAAKLLHALAGAAGYIGADALKGSATKLEAAILNDAVNDGPMHAFDAAFVETLSAIEGAMQTT